MVLAYAKAHEAASDPKGVSMGQSGREYVARCQNAKCGRSKRHTTVAKMGELVERCQYCGALWSFSDSYVLAGQSHSGRGGKAPARMLRAGDLAAIIHALESTKDLRPGYADLYIAWIVVQNKSVRELAADADRIELEGERWTKSRVWTGIQACRAWLDDQLDRRGMRAEEGLEFGKDA